MDAKTWLWRKRSSDKTPTGQETVGDDELQNLKEKLSNALSQCKAKDDLAAKHANQAQQALSGWEHTKEEALSLKQQLDQASHQTLIAQEKISNLDAALKECMQQLRFVREDQEKRINDAVTNTLKQQETIHMALQDKLDETNNTLSKFATENTHLTDILQNKEDLVQELKRRSAQEEADFNKLRAKLDSMLKDNASMNYELRMLEKELEIRNEEREFNRRSSDASHKQHLESVKKIAKLETECQRLRFLVRKRLPGPAAVARMKNQVDMLGKNQSGITMNDLISPIGAAAVKNLPRENSPGCPSKKVNYLIERLCDIEEENKALKEAMSKKTSELQSSRNMCERTASKLSQLEAQFAELSRGQTTTEYPRRIPAPRRLSFASDSEFNACSDAESWPSYLASETENFRDEKSRGSPSCKTVGYSDLSLMDDFVEMEKLAIVCMDKSPAVSLDTTPLLLSPLESKYGASFPQTPGKELIPIINGHSAFSDNDHELPSNDTWAGKYPSWLQDILRIVIEQYRVTHRNPEEIVEDIKAALLEVGCTKPGEVIDRNGKPNISSPCKLRPIGGYISWRSQNSSPVRNSFDPEPVTKAFLNEASRKQLQSGLNESIGKIIELLEKINQQSSKDFSSEQISSQDNISASPYRDSLTPTQYTYRVFQWKGTELNHVLRQFVHTCNDLLNGEAVFEDFVNQLTLTFEWIMDHCFSLQDVSSMKDAIKKQFEWDETRSESEHGPEMNSLYSETEKPHATDELTEVETAKKDLDIKFQSATDKIEALRTKLQISEKSASAADLLNEIESLEESKKMLEDEIEKHKLLNEDLNTQLTMVRVELDEARQKFSSLEVELEEKKKYCNGLETSLLKQKLQSESVTKNELKADAEQTERNYQNGCEISAASEKLAECQETILNLGKQLKALASPKETIPLDKVISVTPCTNTANNIHKSHPSLLDQIQAENGTEHYEVESPKMKEIICTTDPPENHCAPNGHVKSLKPYKSDNNGGRALAIVASKKRGGGFSLLRKFLLGRKKDTGRRMSLPKNA